MADDEVIKRRLLIDGDGTGDDRRLNVLVKAFIKWAGSADTPENTQLGYDRLLAQLAQVEFAVTKSDYAGAMMTRELHNYESISAHIDSGIEQAKRQIDQSKENLALAKKIRWNRMQYDLMAKVIAEQPDRKKTNEQLDQLKRELDTLSATQRQLDRKIDVRRSDFAVLMRAIRELRVKLTDAVPDQPDENGLVVRRTEGCEPPKAPAVTAAKPSGIDSSMLESVDDDDEEVDDVVGHREDDDFGDVEMVPVDNATVETASG